jgi:hypothetical protein
MAPGNKDKPKLSPEALQRYEAEYRVKRFAGILFVSLFLLWAFFYIRYDETRMQKEGAGWPPVLRQDSLKGEITGVFLLSERMRNGIGAIYIEVNDSIDRMVIAQPEATRGKKFNEIVDKGDYIIKYAASDTILLLSKDEDGQKAYHYFVLYEDY